MKQRLGNKREFLRKALRAECLESRQMFAVDPILDHYITTEHTDLAASYSAGSGWSLNVHEDIQGTLDRDHALIYAGTNSSVARPSGTDWNFVGVASGAPLFVGSQNSESGKLYLGASAPGVSPASVVTTNPSVESKGRFSGNAKWVKFSLSSVEHFDSSGNLSDGVFSMWSSDAFGTPKVHMSSFNDGVSNPNGSGLDFTDGVSADDAVWLPAGGHAHYNFGFTKPGRYEVQLSLSAQFTAGGVVTSSPMKLYFSVGNVGQLEFDATSADVQEGAGTASVKVRRIGGSDGQLTVQYATAAGSATAGADYTTTTGTVTFLDKEVEKFISVPITNDTNVEGNESLSISLSNPIPANIQDHYVTFESKSVIAANSSKTITILDDDGSSNTPPTIAPISNVAIDEDTTSGPISVVIGDVQTAASALTLSASSSNPTLISVANIVFGGSGANRTVTLTPEANQFGTASITVTVTDGGGLTASQVFQLTVNPINDAPSISNITNQTTLEDVATGAIPFTISDLENAAGDLVITASSSNTTLVPSENISISGTGINRTVTITPAPQLNGSLTITLTVSDPQGLQATDTFELLIDPVDDLPVPGDDLILVGQSGGVFGNVLGNDSDPDSTSLTTAIGTAPGKGSVTMNSDGSYHYVAGPTFDGTDSFTYLLSDATSSVQGTVTIQAAPATAPIAGLVSDHADIGIAFEAGELEPHVHAHLEEEGGEEHEEHGGIEYAPSEILIQVQSEGAITVPADPQFGFLGAPGQTVYALPTSPNPALPFLGFGTEEILAGTFDGDIRLELVSVSGPGNFSIWNFDTLGNLELLMATSDGVSGDDVVPLSEAAHVHRNIAFSAPGNYEVTFRAVADLGGDVIESEEVTYLFAVATGRAPALTLSAGERLYTEQAAAVQIDAAAMITDTDSTNFDGGFLRVDIPIGAHASDVLSIRNQGTASNQVSILGSDVRIGAAGGPVTIGTWSGGTSGEPLVLNLNSNATAARLQLVLRSIMFANMSDDPTGEHRVVRFVVADGDGEISNATIREVLVTPVNDAPVVTTSSGASSYAENASPTIIDGDVAISDVDSPDFNLGKLIVTIAANLQTQDRLTILAQGDGPGEINLSGNTVLYEGVAIGTYVGGFTTSAALTINLNASATPDATQALARRIAYHNAGDNPGSLTRTIRFQVMDGDGKSSLLASKLVDVTPSNDAPSIRLSTTNQTFIEQGIPKAIDSAAAVGDADSVNFDGGMLTVDLAESAQSDDVLSILNVGVLNNQISVSGNEVRIGTTTGPVVIGTFAGGSSGSPLVISLNANATPARVSTLARNISFQNTSDAPSTTLRTAHFMVTDGDGGTSLEATRNITVTPVNDAPVIVTSSGNTSYTENDGATVIDAAVTVVDVDSLDFNTGKLTVTIAINVQTQDRLTILAQGDAPGEINLSGTSVLYGGVVIGSYVGGFTSSAALTINLNASATPEATQALARRIAFHNVGDNPTSLTRTVRFQVSDGDGKTSLLPSKLVEVTATNDAPTITNLGGPVNYIQNAAAILIGPAGVVSDVDSNDLAGGSLTVSFAAGGIAADRLVIRNQGAGAGRINTAGSDVTYQVGSVVTVIGTWTGGVGTTPLVIQFNSNATKVAVQALVRNLTFQVIGSTPTSSRTIRLSLTDGDGGTSVDADKVVNVIGIAV